MAASALYALIARVRGRWPAAGRILSVFNIAALIQITVLRGGVDWAGVLSASRPEAQWALFKTTCATYGVGTWPFLYHVGGNLTWFVPLGLILRRNLARRALWAGLILSATIEALQWLLMTGIADVDDVLLNTLGALLGWMLARLLSTLAPRGHTSAG